MLALESATQTVLEGSIPAARQAVCNCEHNLRALASTQPDLAASFAHIGPDLEWVFARDGTLTALENGKWCGGCSVPSKAAEELLRTLHITAPVACFLAPSHAAQIAFALTQLGPEQAIIVIMPGVREIALALHCHDFSADISSHRLWFAAGEDWARQMSQILEANPGLPIPQQFIRTALLGEDVSGPLIATAQKIFTHELN